MSTDSSEIRKLSADMRGLGPVARKNARVAIRKTCADTKADGQFLAPVDTGFLRSSITYETHENRSGAWGEVGPTADYGWFVEMGTSRMAPQQYMRPAFDRRAPVLEEILIQLKTGEIQ